MNGIVEKGSLAQIPADAVRLTKEEAVSRQWKLVYEWKPSSDVWPFRYGLGGLGLTTALSSLVIVSHYRRKLKLRQHGRLVTFLPTVLIPTFLSTMVHAKLVTEEILVQTECPVCIQVRSILSQSILGVVYPMVLSPVVAFGFSTVFGTYRLPLFKWQNLPELYSIWRKFTEPFKSRLVILLAINVGFAVAVTNAEAHSLFKIYKKLRLQQDSDLPN